MANPATFPRRILLAVTGMSPQVVTETLFALVTEQDFVPTEIQIITTSLGYNRAAHDLLDAQQGHFHAFCREYALTGQIQFDVSSITVLRDEAGGALDDIQSPAENQRAADEIVRIVSALCQDEEAAVHVSIAGGRKTMGFFAGYALSLFAREQDRLSHVLVSYPFEHNRDFFYPSQARRELITPDGHKVDMADAKVTLAEIPLVRLRAGLPAALLDGTSSYSTTVAAAQASIDPVITLAFDMSCSTLLCGGVRIKVQPMWFACMWWMAQLRVAQRAVRPGTDADVSEFLAVYAKIVKPHSGDYDNAAASLQNGEDFLAKFQELRARLKTKIEQKLGRLAEPYLIESFGRPTQKQYQLCLPPEAIQL